MKHSRIALLLEPHEEVIPQDERWWAGLPSLFVQMSPYLSMRPGVEGSPIVSIASVVPKDLCDAAYQQSVQWFKEASHIKGTNGEELGHLVFQNPSPYWWTPSLALWWVLDVRLFGAIFQWIRLIESLRSVLSTYDPDVIYVCDRGDALEWMYSAVMHVLRDWRSSGEHREIREVKLSGTVGSILSHWKAAEVECHGYWNPLFSVGSRFEKSAGAIDEVGFMGDVMRLSTSNRVNFYFRCLPSSTSVLEVMVARLTGDDGAIVFELDNGKRRQSISIDADGLRLATGEHCAVETTAMNSYLIELAGRHCRLYVNNRLALQGKTLRGSQPECVWGHVIPGADTKSRWASVAWGCRKDPEPSSYRPNFWRPQTPSRNFFPDKGYKLLVEPLRSKQVPSRVGVTSQTERPWSHPPQGACALLKEERDRWYLTEDETAVAYDGVLDGLDSALLSAGNACIQLHRDNGRHSRPGDESIPLSRWHPDRTRDGSLQCELTGLWRQWYGGGIHFPLHRGCSIDGYIARRVEELLPCLVDKIRDAEALDYFCRHYRPTSITCATFVSHDRHLTDVARHHGVLTVAPLDGFGAPEHLLYGLRVTESRCPRVDVCMVSSERQIEALRMAGPLWCELVPCGGAGHDVFAKRRLRARVGGVLQRLGLPSRVERLVVLMSALSPLDVPVLSPGTCRLVLKHMLEVVADRPDLHVVYLPQHNEDLTAMRLCLSDFAQDRLSLIDVSVSPFHAVDVLQHAAVVVGPPSVRLAEFAILGGRPIVLATPESLYELGSQPAACFAPFSRWVGHVDDVHHAIVDVLAQPALESFATAHEALRLSLGPVDGNNAPRQADVILKRGPRQWHPTSRTAKRLEAVSKAPQSDGPHFIRLGAPDGRMLVLLPGDFGILSRVKQYIRTHASAHPGSRIILFDPSNREQLRAEGARYWRDILSPEEHFKLFAESNRRLQDLLARLTPESREFLMPYYHEFASLMVNATFVVQLVRQDLTVPVCLIWQSSYCDLRAFEGLGLDMAVFGGLESWKQISYGEVEESWRSVLGLPEDEIVDAHDRAAQAEIDADREGLAWSSSRWVNRRPDQPCILVSLDGSAQGNLIQAAGPVMREFQRRGVDVVVFTATDAEVRKCREYGMMAYRVPFTSSGRTFLNGMRFVHQIIAEMQSLNQAYAPDAPEWILMHLIAPRMLSYVTTNMMARLALTDMHERLTFDGVLTFGDSTLITHISGDWARQHGLRWICNLPVLVSRHPETSYFPADVHLAYGEQCQEVIKGSGALSEVHNVGSTLFDFSVRNLDEDRAAVQQFVPKWRGRKLVVIGTENSPDELRDIKDLLQVAAMDDVHVVLKLHPDDLEAAYYRLVANCRYRENITMLTRCDLFALLHVADLLICTRSNIIVNAAMLGTPTLVCEFSGDGSGGWRNVTIDFAAEGLSAGCWRVEDVAPTVRHLLFDAQANLDLRKRMQDHLYRFNGPCDGQAAARIVDFMLKCCEERRKVPAGVGRVSPMDSVTVGLGVSSE